MFIEYEICKRSYEAQKQVYDGLLQEKENLFAMTQPSAVRFDKINVVSGNPVNPIEKYIILKEKTKIDERIKEAKEILDCRKEYLEMVEKDLRKSKDIRDRIYVCRIIDRMRVRKIRKVVFYSEAQIYRILDSIYKEIKEL